MINKLIALIRKAGEEILDVYNRRDLNVGKKADRSPITEADIRSNEVIIEELKLIAPRIPIISEENKSIPYAERKTWEKFWLVDPLDGTKEFINRNGEFTVNIALVENGIPIVGIILLPVKGIIFTGEKGIGAFQVETGANGDIRTPLRVSAKTDKSTLLAAISRSHLSDKTKKFIKNINARTISSGSSLKFALVAKGEADIYPRLSPTWEWDTAAGEVVAEAAGAVVCGLDGKALKYNKEVPKHEGFLVCQPELKKKMLEEIIAKII